MKSVIIYISPYGALINGKQVGREFAECMVRQYRHPALHWTEDPDNTETFYHFYKI